MWVRQVHVRRAPGLPGGLPAVELHEGLVLIVGPNASGKSTMLRAIRATLWPDAALPQMLVSTSWHSAAGEHAADLHAGRVSWDPALGVSIRPGGSGLAHFGLRTLLDSENASDQELGHQLARELAGGYDLGAAREWFNRREVLSSNSKLAKGLKEARSALHRANASADSLAQREQRLAELEGEIESARMAARSKAASEALRDLIEASARLDDLTGLDAQFPPGLDALRGDEQEEIAKLDQRLAVLAGELVMLDEQLVVQKTRRKAATFLDAPPAEVELDAWIERIDQARETVREVKRLHEERASAENARDRARARLLDDPADDATRAALPDDILETLARAIAKLREARGKLDAASETVAAWTSWSQSPEGDVHTLGAAIVALRAWLRSPETGELPAPRFAAWVAPLLLVTGVLCAVLAALFDQPWLAAGLALTGVGAGLLLVSGGSPRAGAGADTDRATHRRELERVGLAPQHWDASSAEQKLRDLEQQLDSLQRSERVRVKLDEASARQAGCDEELEACRRELHDLAGRAGLGTDFVELGAVQQAQALVRWLDARDDFARISTQLDEASTAVAQQLAGLGKWLQPLGVEAPSDVAEAHAALKSVGKQLGELRDASRLVDEKTHAREQKRAELSRKQAELDETWERAGAQPGDVATLRQRLDQRTRWAEHAEAKSKAEYALAGARDRFEREAELDELAGREPTEVPLPDVETWLERFTAQAGTLDGLNNELGRIHEALESARAGNDLADALARRRALEQQVADERERAVEDALARMLLDTARDEYQADHAPPVLARAQSLFQHFTHGGWRIEVRSDGAFQAIDVSANETRSLEALSDGTRVQLLLAARIAALEQIEPDTEPLPICLDEALSNCDPERFDLITGALLELVAAGRQIISVSADPAEAEQWRRVCERRGLPAPTAVDLGVLSGRPHDWGGKLPALPPAPRVVPDPAGATPDTYARAIGAGPPEGLRDTASWHLYLVAFDDLEVLAACLRHRLTSVGQWREARRRARAPHGIGEDSARRMDARSALLEGLAAEWRVGRGRPVEPEQLAASGAISPTYEDRVLELQRDHGQDPARFIELVDELKGFRSAKLDELREYLEQQGVLATVEVLSSEEVLAAALGREPAAVDTLGADRAAVYVEWVIGLLG